MSNISVIHEQRPDGLPVLDALRALAQGDYAVRLPVAGNSDERALAAAFNAVAEQNQNFQERPAAPLPRDVDQRIDQLLAQSQFLAQELRRQQSVLTRLSERIVQQAAASPMPAALARSRQRRFAPSIDGRKRSAPLASFLANGSAAAGLPQVGAEDRLILAVQATPAGAEALGEVVGRSGFKALYAADGGAALDLARRFLPDGILLQAGLPDLDAWTLVELLLGTPRLRRIPVQLHFPAGAASQCLQLGTWGHVLAGDTAAVALEGLEKLRRLSGCPMRRVLVADADAERRRALADHLAQEADAEAIPVGCGAEALALLRRGAADCLLAGPRLEDIGTLGLLRQYLESRTLVQGGGEGAAGADTGLPFILYSADARPGTAASAQLGLLAGAPDAAHLLERTTAFLHRLAISPRPYPPSGHHARQGRGKDLIPRKVLLVDDDAVNLYRILDALDQHGMTALVADSGKEGLETLLAHNDAGLVLMDVATPHVEGEDTIRIIRGLEEFRQLPIIAMGPGNGPGDHDRFLKAGASDHLAKPVNVEQLNSLLRVWLA